MKEQSKLAGYKLVTDDLHYEPGEGGLLRITGWVCFPQGYAVQARIGHREIPCRLEKRQRPDVTDHYGQEALPDPEPGFVLTVPGLLAYKGKEAWDGVSGNDTLRIRFVSGGESLPVLEKPMETVFRDYRGDMLKCALEEAEAEDGSVRLKGWCVSLAGSISLRVVDDSYSEIPDVRWTSQPRIDLLPLYSAEDAHICGFVAEIPLKSLSGNRVIIECGNDVFTRTLPVDARRLIKDATKTGRLLALIRKGNRRQTYHLLKQNGVKNFCGALSEQGLSAEEKYAFYISRTKTSPKELKQQAAEAITFAPLFSISVRCGNGDIPCLAQMIRSVTAQSYPNWEICLADESEDTIIRDYMEKNFGKDRRISCFHADGPERSPALESAQGRYVILLDPRTRLAPDALYEIRKAIQKDPDADLFYTDEEITDARGGFAEACFKPDFSPDYLCSMNYIGNLAVFRREFLDMLYHMDGPAGEGCTDSVTQIYDLLLRASEKTDHIVHIPRVLCHTTAPEEEDPSPEMGRARSERETVCLEEGRKALLSHYRRLGTDCEVMISEQFPVYETKYRILGNPMVSIIIPNKDHIEDLDKCVSSVMEKSTWKNLEILVVENNSVLPETFSFYEDLCSRFPAVQIVRYEGDFNFSAINNLGIERAKGEYLILLNNDTEVITPDWIERMLGYCQREGTAAAGARLLYADGTLQHGGVVIGIGSAAAHTDLGRTDTCGGMLNHIVCAREVSCVTGACLMVKASAAREIGGLDEELAVAYNDVDFCLRLREKGYRIIYVPSAKLYHYESRSRGYETTPEKIRRFAGELKKLQERHQKILQDGDPYYNPNLSLERVDYSPRRLYHLEL